MLLEEDSSRITDSPNRCLSAADAVPPAVFGLTLAIYEGQGQVVEALLVLGSDPNARDENGHTGLTMAAQMRRGPILRILAVLSHVDLELNSS